jgi:hypothetical protein
MTDPVNFQSQKLEMSRLRDRALQRLKQHRPELFEMDVQDVANMMHELDVRQTELEVQNERSLPKRTSSI